MLIDAVLYLLLALYLDKVWPIRDFGVARHPLFFLGFGKGKNDEDQAGRRMDTLSSSALV